MRTVVVGIVASSVLATTGCQLLWGVPSVSETADARDAHLDGSSAVDATTALDCAMLVNPPYLCADFESALVFHDGAGAPLPSPSMGVTDMRTSPARSGTVALWLDSSGGTYHVDNLPGGSATKLEATFSIDPARLPSQSASASTDLFILGVQGCEAALVLDSTNSAQLEFQVRMCGVEIQAIVPQPALDVFTDIRMVFDTTTDSATLTTNHGASLSLSFAPVGGGIPHVEFGIIDGNGTSGPEIAFDDVVVTLTP